MNGRPGTAIRLPLADGPPTGYRWVLDLPDGVVLLGQGGFHVQAATPGRYDIKAKLCRPWQADQAIQTIHMVLVVSDH